MLLMGQSYRRKMNKQEKWIMGRLENDGRIVQSPFIPGSRPVHTWMIQSNHQQRLFTIKLLTPFFFSPVGMRNQPGTIYLPIFLWTSLRYTDIIDVEKCHADVHTIEQLKELTDDELLKVKGIGKARVAEIREALEYEE